MFNTSVLVEAARSSAATNAWRSSSGIRTGSHFSRVAGLELLQHWPSAEKDRHVPGSVARC